MKTAIIGLNPAKRRAIFCPATIGAGKGAMNKLSNDERNLLRHYTETERIIHGPMRGAVHQHLLRSGYIEERTVNAQATLVVVSAAGRRALRNRS
jgi:hypothetical protein